MSTVSVDRTQQRQYGADGTRYYSVTQVCHELAGDEPYGDPLAMQRGTDLHLIFALSVAAYVGKAKPPIVPACYAGFHRAMLAWIDAVKPEPVLIERPSVSTMKHLPFAGTPDLLAVCTYRNARVLALPDLKTGQKARWHRIQVQAYQKLDLYREAKALHVLYVHDDGTFTDEPVKADPRDWVAFQSALNCLIWREAA